VIPSRRHTDHAAEIALTTALMANLSAWLRLMVPLPERRKCEERTQFEQLRSKLWEIELPLKKIPFCQFAINLSRSDQERRPGH